MAVYEVLGLDIEVLKIELWLVISNVVFNICGEMEAAHRIDLFDVCEFAVSDLLNTDPFDEGIMKSSCT